MGLIQLTDPKQANGEVKELFDFFEQTFGRVPDPMILYSISPGLFNLRQQFMNFYKLHPTLNYPLLCSIRYLVSKAYNFKHCTKFNEDFLRKQGLTQADLEAMVEDPENALLDDNERTLLAFVVKAIKDPVSITKSDMDQLHAAGWTDRDILDAMAHACEMIISSVLLKTFDMDDSC